MKKEKNMEKLLITGAGTVLAFLITTLCIAVLAFFTYRFHLPQGGIRAGIVMTYVLSCFLGGFFSARKREKKYLRGCVIGMCYLAVLFICSWCRHDGPAFLQEARAALVAAICIGSAVLGGMLA